MSEKIILTRNQLAKFLPTPEAVRAFENLFLQATQLTPSDIGSINENIQITSVSAESAISIANYALSIIQNLSEIVQSLEALPPKNEEIKEDDIDIIREMGTIASQNSDNISITDGNINATLTNNATQLLETSQTLTNYSGAAAGTITNAPSVGNPTKWIKINDNGTSRYIPCW